MLDENQEEKRNKKIKWIKILFTVIFITGTVCFMSWVMFQNGKLVGAAEVCESIDWIPIVNPAAPPEYTCITKAQFNFNQKAGQLPKLNWEVIEGLVQKNETQMEDT